MSESKLKILKMLEEGKITFEQAQELLKATSDNKESGKQYLILILFAIK